MPKFVVEGEFPGISMVQGVIDPATAEARP